MHTNQGEERTSHDTSFTPNLNDQNYTAPPTHQPAQATADQINIHRDFETQDASDNQNERDININDSQTENTSTQNNLNTFIVRGQNDTRTNDEQLGTPFRDRFNTLAEDWQSRAIEFFSHNNNRRNLMAYVEPVSYSQAIEGQDIEKWQDAINSEVESLIENNTRTISDLPSNSNAITAKCIEI